MRRLHLGLVLLLLSTTLALLFVLLTGGSAYAQQVPNDQVTVVMTEMDPFVLDDDGGPEGFYVEIWDEVARALDVQYEVLWVDSFDELLPAIADGRAEIAVAPVAPTAEREALYDFTSAVIASGPQLGFSERLETRPSLLRSVFDLQILTLITVAIGGLLLAAHVIWLFERKRHHDDGDFHSSYVRGASGMASGGPPLPPPLLVTATRLRSPSVVGCSPWS